MKRNLILTSVIAAAALCFAWLPQTTSAQAADAGAAIDAQLLAKYQGTLDSLRKELAAKLPKLDDESRVNALLASDKLDHQFVMLAVLHEATPEGLAKFAQQGKNHEELINQLFSNPQLMKQMLVADGAKAPNARGNATYTPAQYGPAMKIYTDIQKASPKAKDGVLQQLALAVALELAIPIRDIIDPVERYLEFEKAYLDGELDPAFAHFDAWELRFVVDGNEPDWARAWGREMLRNLRPDHIYTTNDGNRYSGMVRTNVIYGSGRVGQDRPELQNYQNILMNGGICGRRAFFGRFILRSFGIPTIARPSRAHGALARWTPNGWVINLGPRWGSGSTNTLYGGDRNFLASTQARKDPEAYIQVKRAQWAGDVLGEHRQYGGQGNHDTWGGVSLITQQRIIEDLKAVELAPVDEKFGEADDADGSVEADLSATGNRQKKTRELAPDEIDIPLESYRLSRPDTPRVNLMEVKNPDYPQLGVRLSTLEQFFFNRVNEAIGRDLRLPTEAEWEYAARAGRSTRWFFGDDSSKLGDYAWFGENAGNKAAQPVGQKNPNPWGLYDMYGNVWELVADIYDREYFAQGPKVDPTGPSGGAGSEIEFSVNVPQAGNYALTAHVVTMNYNQSMNVAVNDDPTETVINLPFTLGKWQDTEPVVLNLNQGGNLLKFCRRNAPQYGSALNSLTLKPVK